MRNRDKPEYRDYQGTAGLARLVEETSADSVLLLHGGEVGNTNTWCWRINHFAIGMRSQFLDQIDKLAQINNRHGIDLDFMAVTFCRFRQSIHKMTGMTVGKDEYKSHFYWNMFNKLFDIFTPLR